MRPSSGSAALPFRCLRTSSSSARRFHRSTTSCRRRNPLCTGPRAGGRDLATEVLMPKLGATMESGTITRWLKEEGDVVKAGEPLLEVMTDKVNIEVEAEVSGILLEITCRADEQVDVHRVIG